VQSSPQPQKKEIRLHKQISFSFADNSLLRFVSKVNFVIVTDFFKYCND